MDEQAQPPEQSAPTTETAPPVQVSKPINTFTEQPATEEHLEQVEREMNAFERSTLRWTKATFGILFVTCLFISLQWCEMRSGSQDTHDLAVAAGKQAQAAKDQVALMRQQLIGTQAAVLDIGVGFNGDGEMNVGLYNSGHVTATDVYLKVEASRGKLPSGVGIGTSLVFSPVIPAILPSRGFNHVWRLPWRPTQLEGERGKWPKGWPGGVTYIFRGEFAYGDGFGNTIRQSFCQTWLPAFTINYKAQTSGGGGALISCSDLQIAISSTLEQERKAERGAERPN